MMKFANGFPFDRRIFLAFWTYFINSFCIFI